MRKTVLFDLDGTLLDTLADITSATNDILARYGRPACTEEEMRSYIGNGARHQFRSAWKAEVEDEQLEEALAAYRPYYADYVGVTHPYDGIVELLQMLRQHGFRTAIVTNKPKQPTERLYSRLLDGLVDVVVGEEPCRPKKPAPDMVEEAMRLLGVSREDCVFVGDSEVDVMTARNAGMPGYACTWGYRSRAELLAAGAEILVDTAEELGDLLLAGEGSARLMTTLKRRRSVRRFEDRAVEPEKIRLLLQTALSVPTSRDLNEVEYFALTERERIDAVAACKAYGAGPLKTAPLAIVLAADEKKADTWVEDSSLAAIVLQLMAEELGLASCWIQLHMRKDADGGDAEENLRRALNLPEGYRAVCALAVGYRAEEKEASRAADLSDQRIHM